RSRALRRTGLHRLRQRARARHGRRGRAAGGTAGGCLAGGSVRGPDRAGAGQFRPGMTMARMSWRRTFAVFLKEFQQMLRDRLTFAMAIGVPVLQLILFGYAINTDPK